MAEDLNYHIIPENGAELVTALDLWNLLYDWNKDIYELTIDQRYRENILHL